MAFETSTNLPFYFRSIRKYDPLSIDEELALAARIKAGDEKAIEKLVKHNLKIVVRLAKKHVGQGVSIDDLIQEGNAGLFDAAKRYEPKGRTRFTSYAVMYVRKYLNGTVAKTGRIVRLPHNQEYQIYKDKHAGVQMSVQIPTRVEVDAPIADDNDSTLGDRLLTSRPEIEAVIEHDSIKQMVGHAIGILRPRDQEIVKDYFGIDRQSEISPEIIAIRQGMTSVRVCQIVKASIKAMKVELDKKK